MDDRLTDDRLDVLERGVRSGVAVIYPADMLALIKEARDGRRDLAQTRAIVSRQIEVYEQQAKDHDQQRDDERRRAEQRVDPWPSLARLPAIIDLQDDFADGRFLSPKRTRDIYAATCARIVAECEAFAACVNQHAAANAEDRVHSHDELDDAFNMCHANLSRIFIMYTPHDDDGGEDARARTLPWERGLCVVWARWLDVVERDASNAVLEASCEYVGVKDAGSDLRKLIRQRDEAKDWRSDRIATPA